jgi:DNA primase RepB-like protein/CHC2-type zinc finger protein
MSDALNRRRRAASNRDARVLPAFLALLVGRERGGLLEARVRREEGGMLQRFHPAGRVRAAADELLKLGAQTDVYVGCAPRLRRAGHLSALGSVWALWVDCDGAASVARLAAFTAAPAVVVRSGTGTNVHAYWPLIRPLTPEEAATANRRLAQAVGADTLSADATRILRVPGTRNFKHDPPRAVTLERFKPLRRFTVAELVGAPTATSSATPASRSRSVVGKDPLRSIPPAVYVQVLTGHVVRRDRKVSCPLHDDGTPSLHVYECPEQGWYCFGCGRGGSIYDLAGELFGVSPRGAGFLQLRLRLRERFPTWTAPAA